MILRIRGVKGSSEMLENYLEPKNWRKSYQQCLESQTEKVTSD